MPRLFQAGWELERGLSRQLTPEEYPVTAANLRDLSRRVFDVDLSPIGELYADVAFKIRDLGIALSDRRAVKVLKLVAASAVLCGRKTVLGSDLWVFRYVWDRDEQIGPLESLVQEVLRKQPTEQAHRLAAIPEKVSTLNVLLRNLWMSKRQLQESNPGAGAGLGYSASKRTGYRIRPLGVADGAVRQSSLYPFGGDSGKDRLDDNIGRTRSRSGRSRLPEGWAGNPCPFAKPAGDPCRRVCGRSLDLLEGRTSHRLATASGHSEC